MVWLTSEASRVYLSTSRRPAICCLLLTVRLATSLPVFGAVNSKERTAKASWQLIYDGSHKGFGSDLVWFGLAWSGLVWSGLVWSVAHKILKAGEN